jgi:hypothetical protein
VIVRNLRLKWIRFDQKQWQALMPDAKIRLKGLCLRHYLRSDHRELIFTQPAWELFCVDFPCFWDADGEWFHEVKYDSFILN